MTGKIITIEGLDGSGKSTQIELLTNRLDELKIEYRFIHFPMLNKGYYGNLIAQYLRGELGPLENVHPKLVALLFAEDRAEHKHKLMEWLDAGQLIILDRYVNSNIAFQCAKTDDPKEKTALKEWINDFEFKHNSLPQPDASFFLNVPFHHIEQSLGSTRAGEDRDYLNGKKDIHEDSLDLQRKVYAEYLQILSEQDNFHEVDCFDDRQQWLPAHEIHQNIVTQIEQLGYLKK